jgi:hypothetical protein
MDNEPQGPVGQEMQTRMFTLRLTPSQHERFVELANKAQTELKLSCNTWVLTRLGLITDQEAKALTERLGLRGRKLRKNINASEQLNQGVQSCNSADQ